MENKKVDDYQVLQSEDLDELEKLVRAEIKSGWLPLGGISMTSHEVFGQLKDGHRYIVIVYAQAMIQSYQQT